MDARIKSGHDERARLGGSFVALTRLDGTLMSRKRLLPGIFWSLS
jgi:hypothetical protein